ncbi:MAG: hypothetical protein HXS40_02175 [Theionarchaea archaeon]|nr:hypothetical protein [Theionarchaea archaeon]
MKKMAIVLAVVLAFSMAPLYADELPNTAIPKLQISAPDSVEPGSEVTVEIIGHYQNKKDAHITCIWLYQDFKLVKVWTWNEDEALRQEEFTVTYTATVTDDTVFFAYTASTIHKSSGATAYISVSNEGS